MTSLLLCMGAHRRSRLLMLCHRPAASGSGAEAAATSSAKARRVWLTQSTCEPAAGVAS